MQEEVLVIGGGDSACEEATFLTRFASMDHVGFIVDDDVPEPRPSMYERAANHQKAFQCAKSRETFRQVKDVG